MTYSERSNLSLGPSAEPSSPSRSNTMRALLISTHYPWPSHCGKTQVLAGLCRFLSQHEAVSRFVFFHIGDRRSDHERSGLTEYRHGERPRFKEVLTNLATAVLRRRWPTFQEAMTYSASAQASLQECIDQEKPDLIIADTIRAAQYIDKLNCFKGKVYIYLDDLFSVRYARLLEILDDFPDESLNPLGNFVEFVPRPLRRLAFNRLILRGLLHWERAAVRYREDEAANIFKRVFLISAKEVEVLRHRSRKDTVFQLKLLTEEKITPKYDAKKRNYFVFLGDLGLPQNHLAILKFVEEGAELLQADLPDYRVKIVGKDPPRELVEACARTRNFEICGFVPNLDEVLSGARGMLAPLLYGGGVKIKCIEALRAGLPLIASQVAVEGLGLKPYVEFLPAESAQEMVALMRRLTDDVEQEQLAKRGREWFEANYSPQLVWTEYEELLLLKAPRLSLSEIISSNTLFIFSFHPMGFSIFSAIYAFLLRQNLTFREEPIVSLVSPIINCLLLTFVAEAFRRTFPRLLKR
jgi:glycosyltransferase involved in cell wall biosynthesis